MNKKCHIEAASLRGTVKVISYELYIIIHIFACVYSCVCVWLVSSEECSLCLPGPWGGRGLLFGLRLEPGVEGVRETALPRLGRLTICGGVRVHTKTHTHTATHTHTHTHMLTYVHTDTFTRQQACLCAPLATATTAAKGAGLQLDLCGKTTWHEGAGFKKKEEEITFKPGVQLKDFEIQKAKKKS